MGARVAIMALLDFEKLMMSSAAARARPSIARAMVAEGRAGEGKGDGFGACGAAGEASPPVAGVCSGAVPADVRK